MKALVCLHAGAAIRSEERPALHPTDRRALALALDLTGEVVALEMTAAVGTPSTALVQAIEAGAHRAVRVVAEELATTDALTGGLVLAAAVDRLQVDLVLFGSDADPEGAGDVPGALAHRRAALYLTAVEALTPAGVEPGSGGGQGPGAVVATVRAGGWRRRVRVPQNAVLGIAASTTAPAPAAATEAAAAAGAGATVELTLAELGLESSLIRRRDDRRGTVEACTRPLVTLESAVAVAALVGGESEAGPGRDGRGIDGT